MDILVEISNRHVHLTKEHIKTLFGDEEFQKVKHLSQPGQFATQHRVNIIHNDKRIENIRVLGPERAQTQVEISKTDSRHLKINTPIRESGDLDNTPGIIIEGPKGQIQLNSGLIIARRHLHASEEQAKILNIKDKQIINLRVDGERGMTFHDVLVRVNNNYNLAFHIDTDEGNAAHIIAETYARLTE
jgi:propanediol utilization protein